MSYDTRILRTHSRLREPLFLEKGEGILLHARGGRTLLDFQAGCWAMCLGHNHESVTKTLQRQAEKVIHTHEFFTNTSASNLTEHLIHAAQLPDSKALYLSSGSEAVELSITLAERITGRKRNLTFDVSYLSSGGKAHTPRDPAFWTDFPLRPCLECPGGSCVDCPQTASLEYDSYGAFVFEPGNSGGRVYLPPERLIKCLCENVRKAGGLIIANEVTTGFGRTGKWFGYQHYDILPDMITLGKGLGNGYPVSAVFVEKNAAAKVEEQGIRYVQSHINDPLGCEIGLAVTRALVSERWIEKASAKGAYFTKKLRKIAEACSYVKEVRERGLMIAMEFQGSPKKSEIIFEKMLEKGFFIGFSENPDMIRFYPSLVVKEEHIDALCLTLEEILRSEKTF